MPETNDTQKHFFGKIKDSIPPHLSLVDEVAELLNISNDSAYRRIRGETLLNIDELKTLCSRFQVSLQDISENTNDAVSFKYKTLESSEESFEDYLNSLLRDLRTIRSFESKEILYAAKDIPIFHHFHFPELTDFKIFFWRKSVLNSPELEDKKFDSSSLNSKYAELGSEIIKEYIHIPAMEIWTEETINSTLKQIEYFWDSGFFSKKADAVLLCEQMNRMMAHIQKQAETGSKFDIDGKRMQAEGNFELYCSEVMIGNNNILVNMGNHQVTYLTHNTLNYLVTTNPAFCLETTHSLKNLIKKSVLISGVSEKQRQQFFRKQHDCIKVLSDKMESNAY